MIKIEPYAEKFKETYWRSVEKKIDANLQDYIISSSEKFLPETFWDNKMPTFKALILAPFEKLKKAWQYMMDTSNYQRMRDECYISGPEEVLNSFYQKFVDAYKSVADSVENGYSMRVRLVRSSGLTVCPYCNRDYINCRGDSASGAQLDHFFGKQDYPIFALCLYNLVPVCGNCNRIKSRQDMEFASPFDETIDWERDIMFHYEPGFGNKPKLVIRGRQEAVRNNIEKMRIEEAYRIHDAEVEELLEKKRIYTQIQTQEFREVLYEINISEQEIKLAIFGPKIMKEATRTRPLGKMMGDLHRKLGIY